MELIQFICIARRTYLLNTSQLTTQPHTCPTQQPFRQKSIAINNEYSFFLDL